MRIAAPVTYPLNKGSSSVTRISIADPPIPGACLQGDTFPYAPLRVEPTSIIEGVRNPNNTCIYITIVEKRTLFCRPTLVRTVRCGILCGQAQMLLVHRFERSIEAGQDMMFSLIRHPSEAGVAWMDPFGFAHKAGALAHYVSALLQCMVRCTKRGLLAPARGAPMSGHR